MVRVSHAALVVLASLAAAVAACRPVSTAVVSHLEIDIQPSMNGDVDVRETVHLRLGSGESESFTRVVDNADADQLEFVAAELDGRPLPRDAGATGPLVAVKDGRALHISVSFQEAPARDAVLTLRYRARGAVAVVGVRGSLTWPALAAHRGYAIPRVTIRIAPPHGSTFFPVPGIAEAGWQVNWEGDAIVANATAVGDNASATVLAEFAIERAGIAEPVWQIRRQLAGELVPAFIAGGLFFLTIGAGIIWMMRFQYPRITRTARATEAGRRAAADPERLAAARALLIGGITCVVCAALTAGAINLTMAQFGVWAYAIPGGILSVGLMLLAQSRRL